MTLLEHLQAHKGGLLRIRSQLYWYGTRGWDKNPGRICLLLDATAAGGSAHINAAAAAATTYRGYTGTSAVAHFLIDGSPQCVWVVKDDVEVVNEAR